MSDAGATKVIPVGEFKIPRRADLTVEVTPECPARLVRKFVARDLPDVGIDLEGVIGRPVGWAELEARDDGVWAVNIRLTETGRAALSTFKYLQPVFSFEDGKMKEIICLSLARDPPRWDEA